MDLKLIVDQTWFTQALNWINLSGVSIHGHCFHVNGHQIEQPRWSEAWNQYSDWGPHPHTTKWLKWPWRSRGVWKCPIMFTIPVSGKETNTDWPKTWYCLEIWVTSTENGGVTPPPPHMWQVPKVENMVWDGKSSLTEAVVTGPGRAFLFYRWWSLGEGLSLDKAWDAIFTLSGAISWVGKQAQLSAKSVSLDDGQQLITQAIIKRHIKPRGPGHPISILPVSTPFNFHNQDLPMQIANLPAAADWWEVPRLGHWLAYQEQGWALQWGWDQGQGQWELWVVPSQSPSLSSDHGFESDWSSASTSSSVASMSERSGGSRHPCCDQRPHREPGGHMEINLPVFKDKDTKDAITYQSWCWDLTVYCHAECWDHNLLPYAIHSLQGYPGDFVSSFGTTTMSRPWMLWTRKSFSYKWVKNRQCQIGECAC